jgi:ribosomal protein L11 methyltransferase
VRRVYVEVCVRVMAHEVEAAETALLELGATGTSQTMPAPSIGRRDAASHTPASSDAPDGTIAVVGYFAPDQVPDPAAIRSWIARLGAPTTNGTDASTHSANVPAISIRVQPWEDWVAQTRASFSTFAVTDHLHIAPPWEADAPAHMDRLIIEPGEAFGTGRHATTRTCLELIDALATDTRERRGAALDIGTGTGILALRAAQCGYRPVIACDYDAIAVRTARSNVRHNARLDGVHLYAGEAAALRVEPRFALIVANIFFNPLAALAPVCARLLAPGGALIVSGIEAGDGEALCKVFQASGLDPIDERTHEGWAAYMLSLRDAHEAAPRPESTREIGY